MYKKKLEIVGYAASKDEAHFKDDNEIWIMNDMYEIVPRYDRLFDIHDIEEIKTRITRSGKGLHYENLKKLTRPIIMQKHFDEIPCSVEHPLQNLIKQYYIPAMGDKLFITCTVSHMIALAIYEGYKDISFYGVDEAVDSEYKDEMPSVLYWLGMAFGKGIRINISDNSPLLKGYFIYGYETLQQKQFIKMLNNEIKRVDEIRQNSVKLQEKFFAEENRCIGASTMLEHIKKLTTNI